MGISTTREEVFGLDSFGVSISFGGREGMCSLDLVGVDYFECEGFQLMVL